MNDNEHVLMSKELLDILNAKSNDIDSTIDNNNFIFDRSKIVVGQETYDCLINDVTLSDYELIINATASRFTCLSLLNSSIEKKLKLPDIIKDKYSFIVTKISIGRSGNFTLTAATTNI